MRNYEEERLQKAIVQHLMLRAKPGVVWFHVPNGISTSVRTGARLKAMGLRPGVSDLYFLLPSGLSAFMELKTKVGRLNPDQKAFRIAVEATGAQWAMIRGIDEALAQLALWGVL